MERSGAGYRVSAHADRAPAFDGADYLINEIQVGGYQATVTDFEIPSRFGVRQTIADTIGIGGIMRGLRTIPVMIEMADEIAQRSAVGSLLLNYTNPMAMVPWGIWAGSSLPADRVVGVCHSVRDTHAFLAETVGVPEADIRFVTAGFNHQCFVYTFEDRRTGEDLYPALREIVEADPDGLGRRVRVELFRRFGYFPTESSEHSSEYVPWFLHLDDQVDHFRCEIDEYIRRSDENLVEFAETKRALDAGEELEVELNDELASQIVRAIETGTERDVYTNIRNEGPSTACRPRRASRCRRRWAPRGYGRTRVGALPVQCLALNRTFLNVVELTVRAALEQRRDLVEAAALLDPNTGATLSTAATHELVDALIDAHGDLIPEGIRRG